MTEVFVTEVFKRGFDFAVMTRQEWCSAEMVFNFETLKP
jgi:hypothetical protein